MADEITLGVFLKGEPHRERPFGPMTPFFLRLSRIGVQMGVRVAGLFPAGLVPPERGRIPAIFWEVERQRFVVRETALPDLIWERVKPRPAHRAGELLRAWGVPLLNSVTLNKWEAYRLLQQEPVIEPFLPETQLLGASQDVLGMIRRYGRAYLKPVTGAMGRGILRLLRQGRRYRGEYVPGPRRPVRTVILRARDLEEWLEERTEDEPYLVQQGLQLEVLGGRMADIRVLAQKDGEGRWGITGIGARLGAPGRYTANLHTGGRGLPLRWLLAHLLPGNPGRQREIEETVRWLALQICRTLESRTGPLGELGIDLGLEPSGRLWYIEHNYYPGRSILQHMGDERGYELAHRRPLEYGCWAVERLRRGESLVLEALPPRTARPSAWPASTPPESTAPYSPAPERPQPPVPQSTATGVHQPPDPRQAVAAHGRPAMETQGSGREIAAGTGPQRALVRQIEPRLQRAGRGHERWGGGLEPSFLRSTGRMVWRPAPRARERLRTAGR